MTTLEKIQELDDGQFHRLADAILKRVEIRYRHLRTHGLNDNGISIKGQPDSYIGISARSCTIAFCYTVEHNGWWNKIYDDVALALNTSPGVEEIVIALPRDVDREGPKDKKINWEQRIRAVAQNKCLTIYDGRKLSGFLDDKYQDLRYEYLSIPFSRLSGAVIVNSCHAVNQQVIGDLKAKNRYDPKHYVARDADNQLRQLWREAFGSKKGCQLIPVVNDSGLGKTSLLCSFAESSGQSVPVLLMQARDCGFNSEDALVRVVLQKLQGVLSPSLQMQEEVALAQEISSIGVLTVVLDGLDEVRSPSNVGRALKYWMESTIGKASILIVSSRPDFWRRCSERSWERWIFFAESSSRKPKSTSEEHPRLPEDRLLGYALPERFSPDELRLAWNKFGLDANVWEAVTSEVRQELLHPLTFRAWVEIAQKEGVPARLATRDEIIELWIQSRLKQEADSVSRLSAELLWNAMVEIAKQIDDGGETYVSIDKLSSVPRFNPTHPPGDVVECLINANILEMIQGRNDSLRFVFDTVYEFFLAEGDVREIRKGNKKVLSSIEIKTFSKTATRLGRIGFRIAGSPEGDAFARALSDNDYAKGLAIIQGRPDKFSAETRRYVFEKCKEAFEKSRKPEVAFLIERVGYVNCDEARETLTAWERCPAVLHTTASYSIVRLNHIAGIPFLIGTCWWFNRNHPYYHRSVLSLLRNASDEFKGALAGHAVAMLKTPSESTQHAQAVTILGYLGDERLAGHLDERLQSNNGLYGYENRGLIAVGSREAAKIFKKSAILTAAKVEAARGNKEHEESASRLWYDICPRSADLRYLVTDAFDDCLISLIDSPQEMASRFGVDIAISSRKSVLIRYIIFSGKDNGRPWYGGEDISDSISRTDWLAWWNQANSMEAKLLLLRLSGKVPDVRIEDIAMDCLGIPELCGSAAYALARVGSVRCLPILRATLASVKAKAPDSILPTHNLVLALGELRDGEAVELLEHVAQDQGHGVREFALDAIAKIGTDEAANALIRISSTLDVGQTFNDCVIEALIAHGSHQTVNRAIEIARQHNEGPKWLIKRMKHVFFIRGWKSGDYYHHVQDSVLIDYLLSAEKEMSPEEKHDLIKSFEQIDSTNARRMLWLFANRAGAQDDVQVVLFEKHRGHMLSSEALEELITRADEGTISKMISSALVAKQIVFSHHIEKMTKFPPQLVVTEVKNRLNDSAQSVEQIARLLLIIGSYGTAGDVKDVTPYLNSKDEMIQNVADETKKFLLDNIRLAETWREAWFAG